MFSSKYALVCMLALQILTSCHAKTINTLGRDKRQTNMIGNTGISSGMGGIVSGMNNFVSSLGSNLGNNANNNFGVQPASTGMGFSGRLGGLGGPSGSDMNSFLDTMGSNLQNSANGLGIGTTEAAFSKSIGNSGPGLNSVMQGMAANFMDSKNSAGLGTIASITSSQNGFGPGPVAAASFSQSPSPAPNRPNAPFQNVYLPASQYEKPQYSFYQQEQAPSYHGTYGFTSHTGAQGQSNIDPATKKQAAPAATAAAAGVSHSIPFLPNGAKCRMGTSLRTLSASFRKFGITALSPALIDVAQLPNTCPNGGISRPIWEGPFITESYCHCPDNSYGFSCTEGFHNPCDQGVQYASADASIPKNYFIECSWGVPNLMKCAPATLWDQELLTCTFAFAEATVSGDSGFTNGAPQYGQPAPSNQAPAQPSYSYQAPAKPSY